MFHVALCAQFFCLTMPAHSVVDISVRKGKSAMIPVYIGGLDPSFSEIVEDHLNLSGFFRMLPEVDATASDGAFPGAQLRNWKHVPGAIFVQTQVNSEDGKKVCRLTFYNVLTERCLGQRIVRQSGDNTRLFSQRIANAIYTQLTGEPGYFHSMIAYTYEQDTNSRNPKRGIALVSIDGKENRTLTSSDKRNCFLPHCAGKRPILTYLIDKGYGQYKKIGVMNFLEKTEFSLPYNKNFNSTRISADGSQILFSCAGENGSSLFAYDLNSGKSYPLTQAHNASIDVSPSYSPDNKRMVFVSDRIGGLPKIFIAGVHSGESPVCISKGQGRYFAPVWSPCGKWIAFIKKMRGQHYLCVSDCNGNQERAVAQALVIDRPSWGPSGRILAYSAKNSDSAPYRLYIVHAFGNPTGGTTMRMIQTPHGANHPSWYPLSLEGHKE
jgi:TolB protein